MNSSRTLLALAGVLLVSATGCQTTTNTAPLPPTATNAAGKPELFAFQTAAMPAIHIGDNNGRIEDIYAYDGKRTTLAGDKIAWQFELKGLPEGGNAAVSIFSLAPEFSCSTTLALNGKRLSDLAQHEPAGNGITTKAQVSLPASAFRLGINTLTIQEHACAVGGWNDSLVEEASVSVTWP